MRLILKYILSNRWLSAYLKKVYKETYVESSPEMAVDEATPIECRASNFEGKRLNLIVPALSEKHVFGGISTALAFFQTLGKEYTHLRIILSDEQNFTAQSNKNFVDWNIVSLDEHDSEEKCIVSAGDRYGKTLCIGKNDVFMATAWWTAFCAKHIQNWQASHYGFNDSKKFVYFIQDYEPGFYAWSSRYALSESTYSESQRFIAILNSGELKDFFDKEGYSFSQSHYFEPTLHPKLKERLERSKVIPKEKRCLIYGRPSVERNAFELIIMGLRAWVKNNPHSAWNFISAGEKHHDIDLGYGKKLSSVGKLTIDSYASELARASVGISLMVSPHPSYPPLEMAAFGVRVVTNRYKGKNLSLLTPHIVNVASLSPEKIALALDECMSLSSNHDAVTNLKWKDYIEKSEDFTLLANTVFDELNA